MELEITPEEFYIGDVNVGQSVVVACHILTGIFPYCARQPGNGLNARILLAMAVHD